MTPDLFEAVRRDLPLAEGAVLLGGFALPLEAPLLAALAAVVAEAPFRHMVTPGGFTMSVAMTNCGAAGWVTDRRGYRYDTIDPASRRPCRRPSTSSRGRRQKRPASAASRPTPA